MSPDTSSDAARPARCLIVCECGARLAGDTDDELVRAAERHIRRVHPDAAGAFSRDDLLAMARSR